ncbi:flagellar hook-associated protein FlgK [Alkaliphilus sp. MSJ-5]|uniref:Flagellar hook-associated protein 1 n=1 Tax=Alkaliphilus flagellatus TaxID=2841507 RepID=A0ABS6G2F1_9FIRM|nr:flagellar hook-associated protein FlgK [Alkaliphilus flagellatus]MBU5676656.1 flagellar hook-associated protein FlgK [Alkaliphilus flagellatus]
MRSTFSGFNSARSGLFAAQRAIDITGHNLANINTRGYTRQRLEQTASTPMKLYGGQGMLGTGVDTTAIHQLRNEFLDYKYRDEASALGFWDAKADGLSFIESIMNEPSDTGISKVIDQLFESFQELGKNPDNITTRTLVRQRATTFTNSINHMYNQLEKMAVDLNFDVNSMVSSINTYGKQIAQLNDQILRSEADGSNANDLRDKRNLLIDDLSKIVDVEVLEVVNPDNPKHKQMVIKVAGKPLVYHKEFTGLKTEKIASKFFNSFDKQIDNYEIKWADGTAFDTDNITGELKALLVMRDGEGGNEKGVPYYIKELNRFVNVFANEINKIHLNGFGLDKSTGLGFFTVDGVTTGGKTINDDIFTKINASNIKLTVDLEDVNKIAASEHPDLLPKDGTIMLEISELRHKQSMFQEGKPEDFIKSLIGTLGVESEEAERSALNQLTLLSEIENRRQSISGVWQDEELSNMVKFQHAYNASARMITTIDEMLDVVINKIGIVGR